jgi:hypothetical protein
MYEVNGARANGLGSQTIASKPDPFLFTTKRISRKK